MNIIVVDDEKLILEGETALIQRCIPEASVKSFSSPVDALEYVHTHTADVAFLDLEMPELHGMKLAKQMKKYCPRLNIIFVTAYQDYYEEAIQLRASGYLLKPLRGEQVHEEMDNLRYAVRRYESGLFVRTFGNFEVFYNGYPLMFRYQKTKELFAYLIDRRGALVSRDELITILWGGETDRPSYYKQIQKDLTDTLARVGKDHILIKQRGVMGILMNEVVCDYYDWLKGIPDGLNSYTGEYMRQYDWAEATWVNLVKATEGSAASDSD